MKLRALIFVAALLPAHAFADGQQFSKGDSITVQPDKAYILIRTFQMQAGGLAGTAEFAPLLIRTLSEEELEQAKALAKNYPENWKDRMESNVVEPVADKPYDEKNGEEFLLTSLKPGVYVLGGVAVTNWAMKSTGSMISSLCMGTVKFEVKPGVVTDLGAVLIARDDEPTTIPEFAGVVSGKPRGFGAVPQTVAIRPATPAMEIPEALKSLPLVPADYRAVSAFPNYVGARIGRLAPLANVLAYDKDGQVIDLRSERELSH